MKALAFLTRGPILIARSLWWHKLYYYGSFVGELGWGDGPSSHLDVLPRWIYLAAAVMIPFAAVYDMAQSFRPSIAYRLVLLLCGAGIAMATFFAMYAVCTDPTSPAIGGVQGRYFVASALLIIPALAGLMRPMSVLQKLYLPALLLFTLSTFATLLSEGLRIYWIS